MNKCNLNDNLIFRFVTESELNRLNEMVNDKIELRCSHLNMCGLNAGVDLLRQLLCSIRLDYDVIVLSEVWATNLEFYGNRPILNGCNFFYELPRNGVVGGVDIRQHMLTIIRPDLNLK